MNSSPAVDIIKKSIPWLIGYDEIQTRDSRWNANLKTLRDYCGQGMCQIVATPMKMLLTIRRRQMRYFDVCKKRRCGKFDTQTAYWNQVKQKVTCLTTFGVSTVNIAQSGKINLQVRVVADLFCLFYCSISRYDKMCYLAFIFICVEDGYIWSSVFNRSIFLKAIITGYLWTAFSFHYSQWCVLIAFL